MKKFGIFGILAVALVFCLVFAACDSDTPSVKTDFEGEWYNTDHNNPLKKDYFKFTGDSFEHRQYNNNGVPSSTVSGTFSSTATEITFSIPGQTFTRQYRLDTALKDLVIEPGPGNIVAGTYGRSRAATSPEDFEGTWKCLYAKAADGVNYTDFSYVFSEGNNFSFTTTHPNSEFDVNRLGTFTYTDKEITFSPQAAGVWDRFKATYNFEGSQLLWIDASSTLHDKYLFVKQ